MKAVKCRVASVVIISIMWNFVPGGERWTAFMGGMVICSIFFLFYDAIFGLD